jgi:hypothetical protein
MVRNISCVLCDSTQSQCSFTGTWNCVQFPSRLNQSLKLDVPCPAAQLKADTYQGNLASKVTFVGLLLMAAGQPHFPPLSCLILCAPSYASLSVSPATLFSEMATKAFDKFSLKSVHFFTKSCQTNASYVELG